MEVKCQCQWSNIALTACTCSQEQSQFHPAAETRLKGNTSKDSSPLYWAHAVLPTAVANCEETKTTTSLPINLPPSTGSYILSKGPRKEPFLKDMASWKYPASVCRAPCTSSRRLNRTYSEQRMRCFFTTTIAFCIGISVGALLPFAFPPVDLLHSTHLPNTESVLNGRGILQPQKLLSTPPLPPSRSNSLEGNSTQTIVSPSGEETNTSATSVYSPVTFVDNSQPSLSSDKESVKSLPVVDGIYLSDWVERLLPKGFSDNDVANWRSLASSSKVTRVDNGCGRMQNRLITYEDGNKACCRYRQNFDQIQGEIFSFYLSQLLGIKNLAPSTLDVINSKNLKWGGVQPELQSAQWVDDKPVVLTKFVNNLNPAFIPSLLRPSTRRVHPPDLPPLTISHSEDGASLMNSSEKRFFDDISELAQWSDLIVFDYLTANLDRMVNNLYNLQWNPTMMEAPAHNLAKDENGLLVFLDNESGLLHGYRLLDKYEHYHRLMLDSICVFRKSTVEAIERLHSYGSIQPLFKSMLSQFASSQLLPMIPDKSVKVLNQRIDTVYRQIQKCQSLYPNRTSNNVQ